MSCGSKKKVINNTPKPSQTITATTEKSDVYDGAAKVKTPPKNLSITESYIYQFSDIAKQEMKLYGIPASITLAQGILESSNGQGNLTKRSNNHFGIKCNGWKGAKVYHDDDKAQECFRKYTHAEYSYRDHSLFLFNRSRYRFLFDYDLLDYKAWARGLKKAGYATDPKYPNKLIGLIERYRLYEYDEQVMKTLQKVKNSKDKKVKKSSSKSIHIVQKGDTLYGISKKYGISIEDLKQINNLKSNTISIGQTLKLK
jgi:flagellum-specific peptidoglycan hydrolase FlgJ